MKSRIRLSIVVAVVLFVAFGFWYRSGYTRASKPAVILGPDTTDTPGRGSTETGYDPYFSKANPIPVEIK